MARVFTISELAQTYEEHPLRKSTILARVQRQRGRLSGITELDLAVDEDTEITDQNHIGGLEFVRELAHKAGVKSDSLVLDAGCGLGGASRTLAYLHGCRVLGVELTEQRCRDAVDLTKLVGLENLVSFTHADFLSAALPLKQFDIVLAQSSFVHFADKQELLARCASLLIETGRLAMEEVCLIRSAATEDERLQLDDLEDIWRSHVSSLSEWLSCLRSARFSVVVNEDLTGAFRDYYSKLLGIFERLPAGSFPDNEVKAWHDALSLAHAGVIGYIRIVASLQSD
jgi:SAM-dependent methyltransferase